MKADRLSSKISEKGNIEGKIPEIISKNTVIYLSPNLTEEKKQERVNLYKKHISLYGG